MLRALPAQSNNAVDREIDGLESGSSVREITAGHCSATGGCVDRDRQASECFVGNLLVFRTIPVGHAVCDTAEHAQQREQSEGQTQEKFNPIHFRPRSSCVDWALAQGVIFVG